MLKKKEAEAPSAVERMEALIYPAIFVPFKGTPVGVIAKKLTSTEIKSCGDFSLIETFQDQLINEAKQKKLSFKDMCAFAEIQYGVVKKSLINPTYDEIIKMICIREKIDIEKIKKELEEIEEKINELEFTDKNNKELKTLKDIFYQRKMQTYYFLPDDFIGAVFYFAVDYENSDISLVSEQMLYESAILAMKGHNNPSDHLTGAFTDFNKTDINKRAWAIYHEKQKNENAEL